MFINRDVAFEVVEDSVKREQSKLIARLLTLVFIALLVNIPLIWPALVAAPLRMVTTAIALLITALAWIGVKRGYLVPSRWLAAVGYWGLIMFLVARTGGLTSPWLMAQVVFVLLVGLLMDEGTAITLGVLSVVGDGLLFIFNDYVAEINQSSGMPIEFLSVALINFFLVGSLIIFGTRLSKRQSALARENELRYRSLFEKTNDAVFLIGEDNRLLKVNDQAARMLGHTAEELTGMHIDQVVAPEELEDAYAVAGQLEEQGILPVYERIMVRKDGSRFTAEINVAMITDEEGRQVHIQSVVRDVSNRKRLEQQLRDNLAEMENIAMQDPLTGLLNRRAIAEHVDVEWHRSQRERQPMCVLLIDMDNLKEINDRYGHKTGDEALLQLAAALRKSKRRYDWMGRWGGDEFLVVLPNTNLVQAKEVAERCQSVIEREPLTDPEGRPVKVEASIGLACYSGREGEELPLDMLLAQADQALYEAKEAGRNRVAIYRD